MEMFKVKRKIKQNWTVSQDVVTELKKIAQRNQISLSETVDQVLFKFLVDNKVLK
jgi:RNase P subunit RPR2